MSMRPARRRTPSALWIELPSLLLGLLLAFAAFAASAAGGTWHGATPPPGLGGPIELVDQRGAPFSLDRLKGRPVLLFFGFTACGTTCPMALLTARELLASSDDRLAPAVVFVTLDPLSDGPRELAAHLGRIDARIVGLTGEPARIERVAERYGVGVRTRPGGVDHSSMWYLLDAQGRLQRVYPFNTPASDLLADLRLGADTLQMVKR
jgi:protein SCO1/2